MLAQDQKEQLIWQEPRVEHGAELGLCGAESWEVPVHWVTLLPAVVSHFPLHTNVSSLAFPMLCISVGVGSLSPTAAVPGAQGRRRSGMEAQTGKVSHHSSADCCYRNPVLAVNQSQVFAPPFCLSSSQIPLDLEHFSGQGSCRCHRQDLGGDFSLSAVCQGTLKTPILLFSFMELVGFSTPQEAEATIILAFPH